MPEARRGEQLSGPADVCAVWQDVRSHGSAESTAYQRELDPDARPVSDQADECRAEPSHGGQEKYKSGNRDQQGDPFADRGCTRCTIGS